MRRLALFAGVGLAAGCVAGPTTVAGPSVTAAAPATATPSPTASATPSASAGPANVATAVAIPRSFHYFSVGQGASFRILLFDEERSQPPLEVLRTGAIPAEAGPGVRLDGFSVSADGRVVVVMRRLSPQQTTYYVLRPETGEVRALLSGGDLGPPIVTADGQRIAFSRTSPDPAINGLWLFAIAAGAPAPSRLVRDEPQRVGSPPQPVAWSGDGRWLAISPVLGPGGAEIAVVDPAMGETLFSAATNTFVGGAARVLGPGYAIDWRAGEHGLLVTSSRDAFGGQSEIYSADVTTGALRALYRPSSSATLGVAAMHPALDRYAVQEGALGRGPGAPNTMSVRRLDGSATKVAESGFMTDPWWSRDGTKLFSITGGDDSTGGISNLLGTGGGTVFCRRGGSAPPCT